MHIPLLWLSHVYSPKKHEQQPGNQPQYGVLEALSTGGIASHQTSTPSEAFTVRFLESQEVWWVWPAFLAGIHSALGLIHIQIHSWPRAGYLSQHYSLSDNQDLQGRKKKKNILGAFIFFLKWCLVSIWVYENPQLILSFSLKWPVLGSLCNREHFIANFSFFLFFDSR